MLKQIRISVLNMSCLCVKKNANKFYLRELIMNVYKVMKIYKSLLSKISHQLLVSSVVIDT